MKVTIHQAICGEKNKGWDLLATSLDNPTLAKNIAFKTDMQDTPPGGVTWEFALRGYAFNDHYLFIKSFPDNSNEVRKGRVFSHCLIVPKEALGKIDDISPILNLLINEINKELKPEPIELEFKNQDQYKLPDAMVGRFNKVVKGFTKLPQHLNTIIWVGQENYADAVCRFWQMLSQSEREKFNFGINFNVNEIPKDNINLITIPVNSETKFTSAGFCLVGKNDSAILTDFSEQFIAGDIAAKRKLDQFLEAVEARSISREEIAMVAKGLKTYEILNEVTDIRKLITLANIVSNISPHASKGKKIKKQLIDRVSEVAQTLKQEDLLMLKPLKLDSFERAESDLSNTVATWLNNNLYSKESNSVNDYSNLIKLSLEDNKEKGWFLSILKSEAKKFLTKLNKESVLLFFDWIKKDTDLIPLMDTHIDKSSDAETLMIASLPKKFETWLDQLNEFASKHKLFSLYATILKRKLPFKEAMEELLVIDTDPKHLKGIEIITKGVTPKEIINFATQKTDFRLITISGDLCYRESSLLESIDVSNKIWLNIWVHALKQGNQFHRGIKNPQNKAFEIFDQLIKGESIDLVILRKIAEYHGSGILKYKQRAKLWSKLTDEIKNPVLQNTLAEVINSNTTSQWNIAYKDVRAEVLKPNSLKYLFKKANTNHVIWLFKNRGELTESNLIDFLNERTISFNISDCKELGIIINQYRYRSAFNLINDHLIKKNSAFNSTVEVTANTFRTNTFAFDFLGLLGTHAPKKNLNPNSKIKILFASANPNNSDRIRADKELRELDKTLQSLKYREKIDLNPKGAIEFKEFAKAILEYEPDIVHFSGHGDKFGIAMEKTSGDLQAVPNKILDDLFKLFEGKITCVVLNSCYSEKQAELISKHNMYVVGMNDEIDDELAINFSSAFYTSLSTGKDPSFSFKYALTAAKIENEASASIPVLWYQGGKISAANKNAKDSQAVEIKIKKSKKK